MFSIQYQLQWRGEANRSIPLLLLLVRSTCIHHCNAILHVVMQTFVHVNFKNETHIEQKIKIEHVSLFLLYD